MTYMIAAELKMIERNKIQVYIFKVKAIIKCTYKNLGIKSQKLQHFPKNLLPMKVCFMIIKSLDTKEDNSKLFKTKQPIPLSPI